MQVVLLEQDMDMSCWMPPGTPTGAQVEPPSWLTKTSAPTAMQSLESGHATAPSPSAPWGTWAALHVVPPSMLRRMAPPNGPVGSAVTPAAMQIVAVGHETPTSVLSVAGIAESVQVEPPSLLRSVAPRPTATQRDASVHEMPSSAGAPVGSFSLDQLAPPSVDTDTAAAAESVAPTAMQVEELSAHDRVQATEARSRASSYWEDGSP